MQTWTDDQFDAAMDRAHNASEREEVEEMEGFDPDRDHDERANGDYDDQDGE